MDGELSVWVVDKTEPTALYRTTAHNFFVKIAFTNNRPAIYDGVNYGLPQPLTIKGEKGRIHGQFKLPPGTYLVQVFATCNNVVCNLIYAQVVPGEVTTVYAVPTSVRLCILAAMLGIKYGSVQLADGKDVALARVAQDTAGQALRAMEALLKDIKGDANPLLLITEEDIALAKKLEKKGQT
jgi:hypothetical protein